MVITKTKDFTKKKKPKPPRHSTILSPADGDKWYFRVRRNPSVTCSHHNVILLPYCDLLLQYHNRTRPSTRSRLRVRAAWLRRTCGPCDTCERVTRLRLFPTTRTRVPTIARRCAVGIFYSWLPALFRPTDANNNNNIIARTRCDRNVNGTARYSDPMTVGARYASWVGTGRCCCRGFRRYGGKTVVKNETWQSECVSKTPCRYIGVSLTSVRLFALISFLKIVYFNRRDISYPKLEYRYSKYDKWMTPSCFSYSFFAF